MLAETLEKMQLSESSMTENYGGWTIGQFQCDGRTLWTLKTALECKLLK